MKLWVVAGALALCQVGLHAQARQRRLELVRGVGQKALLGRQRIVQAGQQVVHRGDQRCDFQRHGLVVQRGKVVGAACPDALFELVQRLDAACQRQPHE